MALIKITAPITVLHKGKEHKFKAGDVVQSSQFPEIERLLKEQKKKGRIEKNGL
jgi:hypothetical protein